MRRNCKVCGFVGFGRGQGRKDTAICLSNSKMGHSAGALAPIWKVARGGRPPCSESEDAWHFKDFQRHRAYGNISGLVLAVATATSFRGQKHV